MNGVLLPYTATATSAILRIICANARHHDERSPNVHVYTTHLSCAAQPRYTDDYQVAKTARRRLFVSLYRRLLLAGIRGILPGVSLRLLVIASTILLLRIALILVATR